MRNTIAATLIAVFFTASLVGCKSSPKMAWWKPGSKTAATAAATEGAVLANSAPSLPADIAREAESLAISSPAISMTAPGFAATSPVVSGGGMAAPYSPSISLTPAVQPAPVMSAPASIAKTTPYGSGSRAASTAYPTTGASPYAAAAAPVMAAITPTQSPVVNSRVPHADSLGSVSMPYNPGAVPPARTVVAAAATPGITADRYGSSSLASSAPVYQAATKAPAYKAPTRVAAAAPRFSGADRYSNTSLASPVITPTAPSLASAPKRSSSFGTPAVAGLAGGSYAASAPGMAGVPAIAKSVAPVVKPTVTTPVVVAATPAIGTVPPLASAPAYRPGGTASYQGTTPSLSSVQVATRPTAPVVKPAATTPSDRYESVPAPRYR